MLRRFQPIVGGTATAGVAPHRAIVMGLLCVSAQCRYVASANAGAANPVMKAESAAGSSPALSTGVELNKHWTPATPATADAADKEAVEVIKNGLKLVRALGGVMWIALRWTWWAVWFVLEALFHTAVCIVWP